MNRNTNNSNRTATIETLETRQLQSATPVDFTGQFVVTTNGTRIEMDLHHGTVKTNYAGDVISGGTDLKLTATETNNVLKGTLKDAAGKSHTFAASLSGKSLTVKVDGQPTVLAKVSNTPATPSTTPTLVKHTTNLFSYQSPTGWSEQESTSGIMISSADKTQQVAILSGIGNGIFGTATITQAQNKAGATTVYRKIIANGWTADGLYKQEELDLITYKVNGQVFASGEVITTLCDYYAGNYNDSTGTYAGETMVMVDIITAPAAKFVAAAPTLIKTIGSIKINATGATGAVSTAKAAAKVGDDWYDSGYYDPGVEGNWSYGGGFDYSSNPYVYDEQSYMADTSTVYDAGNDAFCDYILE